VPCGDCFCLGLGEPKCPGSARLAFTQALVDAGRLDREGEAEALQETRPVRGRGGEDEAGEHGSVL
jgi:hypothetical protein